MLGASVAHPHATAGVPLVQIRRKSSTTLAQRFSLILTSRRLEARVVQRLCARKLSTCAAFYRAAESKASGQTCGNTVAHSEVFAVSLLGSRGPHEARNKPFNPALSVGTTQRPLVARETRSRLSVRKSRDDGRRIITTSCGTTGSKPSRVQRAVPSTRHNASCGSCLDAPRCLQRGVASWVLAERE